MIYFDPSLEFRKYVQVPRTEQQKAKKLAQLAARTRKHPELTISLIPTEEGIIAAILEGYDRGEDILDPAMFEQEDILAFALENDLLNDPQVQSAILAAKPRKTA